MNTKKLIVFLLWAFIPMVVVGLVMLFGAAALGGQSDDVIDSAPTAALRGFVFSAGAMLIPLLPLPKWLVGPLRYYQCANVWTCYHWTGFWKWVFHSHYFDTLLDECKKVWPYGKGKAVLDGYKDIYTHKLESIDGPDIHFWYGTKEAYVAKPQVEHLKKLHPETKVEVFKGMNHGQFLVDHPEEVAERILGLIR